MEASFDDLKVNDRNSFVKFLELLSKDLTHNPERWENITTASFLEAASRYAEDIQGYYHNFNTGVDADKPSWQIFADILKGAAIYE